MSSNGKELFEAAWNNGVKEMEMILANCSQDDIDWQNPDNVSNSRIVNTYMLYA